MYKNDYQGGKSFTIGDHGEKSFTSMAKAMGWNPRNGSKHEDMRHHIDTWIDVFGVTMSVEVKGIKGGIDEGLITIELLNVQGNHGWLYGKADVIAFQVTNDEWLMVDRGDLRKMVEAKMGIDSPFQLNAADSSRNKFCRAPKWYRRFDRKDAITNLTIREVREIAL